MVREEVKLHVPEMRMQRTEWVMGVPETKMVRQRIVMNIPDIVVTDIKGKGQRTEQETKRISAQAQATSAQVAHEMKSEFGLIARAGVDETFQCEKTKLQATFRKSFDELTKNQATVMAARQAAEKVGAKDLFQTYDSALTAVTKSKADLLSQYRTVRREFAEKHKNALKNL